MASAGHSPACVQWSGSTTAPDKGIDIQVDVPADTLDTGYLARPNTIFQAKKHKMPASAILKEMCPNGVLSPTISKQSEIDGSYIIVSLADDCTSRPMKSGRVDAMTRAMKDDPNRDSIHLDFYDRSKLLQWLRQYPAVVLWVRSVLGQSLSGWKPYGRWSNPPARDNDTLILASGVSITMPSGTGGKLSIEDAITPMRELVRSTSKAIRVTGLSGVGKTRIVQSLFDDSWGENVLDRTIAIYADAGENLDPSAHTMLDRLIADSRRAIMVLDNCPSDLHRALAAKVDAADSQVSLVTVEYDIRDDKPQTTEVVHIEAEGPDVAEQLLLRRFPGIGQLNARKIAEFANGNARVSLAVAERVEEGESLALLSDAQLFDRLFEQRKEPDDNLRTHAEVLSLVYSFSVNSSEDGIDELKVLGSICGSPRTQLFRSVATLLKRHIVQKRSHWRAILPHAIANRLAQDALRNIPSENLRSAFEAPGRERLLMSFAHRLGFMHDHPVAREIVESWLQDENLLGNLSALNDTGTRILEYVAPVAPDAVLDRIEAEIDSDGFSGLESGDHPGRITLLNLLQSLAYEPENFDRCVAMLLRVADFEDESNNYDPVRDKIVQFFQPYLSGTHASPSQRLAVVREALLSGDPKRRSLGFQMLATALGGPSWMGSGINEFGTRPRDFGYHPNHDQLVDWRNQFIDLAVEMDRRNDAELSGSARSVLAQSFRGLWRHQAMREKLADAARKLNAIQPWIEGWKAVRSTIRFDYRKTQPEDCAESMPEDLAALARDLAPANLFSNIRAYVFGGWEDLRELYDEFDDEDPKKYDSSERRLSKRSEELGEEFACSGRSMSELGQDLFLNECMSFRLEAFGRGLARTTPNCDAAWHEMVAELHRYGAESFNCSVLSGFIEEIDTQDRPAAQAMLDQCLDDKLLRRVFVELTPPRSFDEKDLERCIAALQHADTRVEGYLSLLWHDFYAGLPENRLLDLIGILLKKPNGDDIVLNGLCIKLRREPRETNHKDADILGVQMRRVGLMAATQRLIRSQRDPGGATDHNMESVVRAAFSFDGIEDEKEKWLDAIFASVDQCGGYMRSFDGAIRATAELEPNSFLDRVFSGDEDTRRRRCLFIESEVMNKLPMAGVDIEVLIRWCQSQADPGGWPVVGAGINLWKMGADGSTVELSEAAVRFLEASPAPEAVLRAFARKLELGVCYGPLSDIMQNRMTAFRALVRHCNPDIATAAGDVIKGAAERINEMRQWEQRVDEEFEQRFE